MQRWLGTILAMVGLMGIVACSSVDKHKKREELRGRDQTEQRDLDRNVDRNR